MSANSKSNTMRSYPFYIGGIVLTAFGTAHLTRKLFDWPNLYAILLFIILLAVFYLTLKPNLEEKKPTRWLIFSGIPLLFLGFWVFMISQFGQFNWSSILFHIQIGMEMNRAKAIHHLEIHSVQVLLGVGAVAFGFLFLINQSAGFRRLENGSPFCFCFSTRR